MEEALNIQIIKLGQNMEQDIVMLNVLRNSLSLVKLIQRLGEIMQLAAHSLIFGKQTNKQVLIPATLVEYQDTINAKELSVDLETKDTKAFVIKMGVG